MTAMTLHRFASSHSSDRTHIDLRLVLLPAIDLILFRSVSKPAVGDTFLELLNEGYDWRPSVCGKVSYVKVGSDIILLNEL